MELTTMRELRQVSFGCPNDLVEKIDRLANEEMIPRAAVIRRALLWEARAAEMSRDDKQDD
jgi:hypothetical protein